MSDEKAKGEGLRAPLFFGLLLLMPGSPVVADEPIDRQLLEACGRLQSAEERLACFESLLAPERAATASVEPAPTPAAVDDEPARNEAAAVSAVAEPSAALPDNQAVPQAARAGDELGAEYLQSGSGDERPLNVSATVTEVWKQGDRKLYFRFDNGQLWRQMEPGYFGYPRDASFEVSIRQSFMGDYQMRLAGQARTTRIVRVE